MLTHCGKECDQHNKKISQHLGGHVFVVEINKAKFWRRKYNYSGIVNKLWCLLWSKMQYSLYRQWCYVEETLWWNWLMKTSGKEEQFPSNRLPPPD